MRQLDIGCSGFTRTWDGYTCEGIDIIPHPDQPQIMEADLAVEPIPCDDNSYDLVTAYDFLEHLPMVMYLPWYNPSTKEWVIKRRDVMIELFNEVYRVLKDGGIFYSQTPIYPDKTVFQDPTHLSVWTDDTMNYFSGDYFGFHDHYSHTSRFEQSEKRIENGHAFVTLKAIKGVPEGTGYQLHY